MKSFEGGIRGGGVGFSKNPSKFKKFSPRGRGFDNQNPPWIDPDPYSLYPT